MFKTLYIVLACVATSVISIKGVPTQLPSPQPRLITSFARFISHFTNRNPFDYNNYGCWCGSGNRGQTVMDEIDMCCKIHDECYKGWDSSASYYDIGSNWMCTDSPASVQYKACMCDKETAECFAQNTYNEDLKGWCN